MDMNVPESQQIVQVKRGRGRPRKQVLSQEEAEDEVIRKYLCREEMTLEEVALALWMSEGRKTKHPMTKMMMLNIINGAMMKIRRGLKKYGIKTLDDVFDPKFRKVSNGTYSNGIDSSN